MCILAFVIGWGGGDVSQRRRLTAICDKVLSLNANCCKRKKLQVEAPRAQFSKGKKPARPCARCGLRNVLRARCPKDARILSKAIWFEARKGMDRFLDRICHRTSSFLPEWAQQKKRANLAGPSCNRPGRNRHPCCDRRLSPSQSQSAHGPG